MRYCKGLWHYRNLTYATLREALLAVWPLARADIQAARKEEAA